MRRRPAPIGSVLAWLGVALASAWIAPTALLAEDEGTPIVLTNEDIDRIQTESRAGQREGSVLILTGNAGDAAPSGLYETTAPAHGARPAAGSWQEEYYRLKALALRQAIERGESIDFTDATAVPPVRARTEVPPAAAIVVPVAGRTCMYGADGELLHQPSGANCATTRSQAAQTRTSGEHDACIYDHDGDVLHTPPGRSCNRH